MRNNSVFPMDTDGWSLYTFPVETHPHFLSNISSFVDNSLYHSRYFYVSGSMALQDVFNCMSKFTGALLLWVASGSSSKRTHNLGGNSSGSNTIKCKSYTKVNHSACARHNLVGFGRNFRLKGESVIPVIFGKISSFSVRQLCSKAGQLQSLPLLSLAAALTRPFDNESQNMLAVPLEKDDVLMQRSMDQNHCEVENHGCGDLYFTNFSCSRHAAEPQTGIEFPTILDNVLAGGTNSSWMSEVLVGTGSKTMKIMKIKSLNVYAYGFYVHPYDLCVKLGQKYASIPASELNKHHSFYQDLLREDISMTVRLVVSINGMKISTVKNAFENSLRARLTKTNPDTDYDCLKRFASLFSQDIPIRAGTTIYFRRTADGHLITEIGGNQIGAVHSRDLCRAFFDMYIGDVPACEQTKEEIGRNVASIIGKRN